MRDGLEILLDNTKVWYNDKCSEDFWYIRSIGEDDRCNSWVFFNWLVPLSESNVTLEKCIVPICMI